VRVFHGVRPSQPPRPRVMQGLAARLNLKRSQGMPRAGYGAAKRVEFRGADLVLLKRRQHPPRVNGLRTRSLALSETPCTWRRPLRGTWEASFVSGQSTGPAHEGNSCTMGMHADEESDGCIVLRKPRTMPSNIGGGDGGGKAAGRGEGKLQRMLRTQRRIRHVTEAACPRIGAAWVPNTPNADHV
jgi:hypothetical protein